MTAFLDTFRSLPRAARWLIGLGVALAVFFVAVRPTLDILSGLSGRAAGAMGELDHEGRDQAAREQAASQVRAGMQMFGPVAFPGEPAERSEAFNRKVNEILARHSVQSDRRTTRTAPVEPGPIDAVAGQGKRVDRLITDIQFDAAPEDAAAVLADLESAPEVASVTRVQLRRESGGDAGQAAVRSLRVNLSVEAWLLGRKEGGR